MLNKYMNIIFLWVYKNKNLRRQSCNFIFKCSSQPTFSRSNSYSGEATILVETMEVVVESIGLGADNSVQVPTLPFNSGVTLDKVPHLFKPLFQNV